MELARLSVGQEFILESDHFEYPKIYRRISRAREDGLVEPGRVLCLSIRDSDGSVEFVYLDDQESVVIPGNDIVEYWGLRRDNLMANRIYF